MLRGDRRGLKLGVVCGFGLGGRDVADRLEQAAVVEPVDPFSPAVVPRFSFRAPDVVDVLERVCGEVGYPASIRVDQGSEFVSRELGLWTYTRSVVLDFSRPGKPTDNAFIEPFNGKSRAERLNQHWFMSLDDAVRKCETWRRDYNEVRPHYPRHVGLPHGTLKGPSWHGRFVAVVWTPAIEVLGAEFRPDRGLPPEKWSSVK